MFSTTQISFIEMKLQQMYNLGYKNYLIHTNTNLGTTNREHRDLVMYFSKDKFSYTDDFNFRTNSDTIKIEVMTGNPSSQYQYDREVVSQFNNKSVSVPKYEFIVSCYESVIHLDSIALQRYEYTNSRAYNYEFYLIPFFLGLLFLYVWLHNTFLKTFSRGEKVW